MVFSSPDSATFIEDVAALKKQNEQLREDREQQLINMQVLKGEIERLSTQLNQAYSSAGES